MRANTRANTQVTCRPLSRGSTTRRRRCGHRCQPTLVLGYR
jgi:hypothetical protein